MLRRVVIGPNQYTFINYQSFFQSFLAEVSQLTPPQNLRILTDDMAIIYMSNPTKDRLCNRIVVME